MPSPNDWSAAAVLSLRLAMLVPYANLRVGFGYWIASVALGIVPPLPVSVVGLNVTADDARNRKPPLSKPQESGLSVLKFTFTGTPPVGPLVVVLTFVMPAFRADVAPPAPEAK